MVSIIIPIYNAEGFIKQTINSVLAQNYINWELLLINDGSTDNSEKIISTCLTDKRIHYIKKDNSGVCNARNMGADLSKGDYLCFLDADDIFLPDNVQQKLEFLQKFPTIPLVHSNVQELDESGIKTGKVYRGKKGNVLDLLLSWEETIIPAPSSIMVRRDVFFEIGKWDTNFSTAADQDFFFRIAARHPIGHIDRILTGYRVLNNSMSRNIKVMEKDHIAVYQKASRNGLFMSHSFKKKCFSNLYMILAGSWWANGNNKKRALYFIIKSIISYPPILVSLFKKKISTK